MKNSQLAIILSILLIAVLPYIFLAFFTVPAADDFLQAHESLERGLFGYVEWRYMSWNGRYAADFLVALYNLIGHKLSESFITNFYFLSSLLFMFSYALASFIFIVILFGRRSLRTGLIFALMALLYSLSNSEVRSTFFWLSGGIAYTLANSFFIILVALFVRFFKIFRQRKTLLASLVLIPIINGLSETSMVACTAFVLSLIFLESLFLTGFRGRLVLNKIALCICTIFSALLVYMAPGNANRMSADGQLEISYIKVICETMVFASLKIFHLINPFWIVLVLITMFLSQQLVSTETKKVFKASKFLWIVLASLVLAFYASYFVRFYSSGSSGPLRADSTSYTIFFLITVFIGFFVGTSFDWLKPFPKWTYNKLLLLFITSFSLFSFAANYSLYSLAHDFRLLKDHYTYYQEIYPELIQAVPDAEIELPPEPRVKVLRWKCYLTDDKNYWVNQAVADYFRLESVIVKDGGGTDPDAPGTGECGG
ncbi:DUF6056 family protein [Leptolyngbya sp. BC1307]|uniref:DUF6056 family protein n=1 Tax=Leptolyngbya sp. BC1307 TaxID=2029589 RepID=UPI000EFB1707|nr:DUF6056 family protein [Leptolyngbya sp. BC1307]